MAHARSRLREIVSRYPATISIVQEVRCGSVSRELTAAAREHGADLIVMASHRPGLRDYLIGPISAHVAQHGPCSVLVLRRDVAAAAVAAPSSAADGGNTG
jgi:nucleotide-binding universal stress UspA family protein